MELLLILILWPVLSYAVARYAAGRGHNLVTTFIGAMLFSPLLAWILSALTPVNEEKLIEKGKRQRCDACRKPIDPDATRCSYCQSEIAVPSGRL